MTKLINYIKLNGQLNEPLKLFKLNNMANPNQLEKPLNRVLEFIRLEQKDIKRLVLLTVSIGVLSLATPVTIQALVNVVTMGGVLKPLYVISFMLFIILCLSGALYVLERYIVELIQRRFFVRKAISAAINTQYAKAEIHDHVNSVELMNRFFDVMTVQKSAASLLTYGLSATLQGIIGSVVLMFYSFYFAVVVFIVLLIIAFIVFGIGKFATETAIQESKAKYKVAAWLEVIARNTTMFKFLNGVQYGVEHTDALANAYLADRKKHFSSLLYQNISSVFIYASAGTAMLALGGMLVIQGQINLGQFVAAELIIFNVLVAYRKFVEYLEYYYDLVAAFDKLGMIDDLPQENIGNYTLNLDQGLSIEVKDLSFNFSTSRPILNKLNFQLKPREVLCIYGRSGSGKSTLAEILTGLRQPQSGFIEYNGINLKAVAIDKLRQHIGYIGQTEILESTILNNLTLDNQNIEVAEIYSLLKSINLYDAISRLDNGLETKLASNAAPLSNQEAQLLVFARVLLAKPKLIILDELLDDMDAKYQAGVLAELLSDHRTYSLIVLTKSQTISQYFDNTIMLNHD